MRNDLTIIYYTANIDNPIFESRIRRTLVNTAKGLPIVSVSQKPIDFGTNICVGEVGPSYHNCFRQFLIGVKEAKTRFVCNHEADCLHPKEYFNFVPPTDDAFYVSEPLYVLFAQRGKSKFYCLKPRGSEGSMVVNREYLIDALERMLDGRPMWSKPYEYPEGFQYLLYLGKRRKFITSIPSVSIKTDTQLHRKTPHSSASRTRELPYWGNSSDLIRKYLG